MTEDSYPRHVETFEVVLLKNDKHEFNALPADFKRVIVEATDSLQAQLDEAVTKITGYRPMCATKPGVATDPEVAARRREMEGPAVDRSKI